MNLEILNTLLEANSEMPSKEEILRRFRTDFASRLGARLAGGTSHVPEPLDDDALAPEGRFGGPAALEVRPAEEPTGVPVEASFPEPEAAPEAADVNERYPEPEAAPEAADANEPFPEPEALERTAAGLFPDTEQSQELDPQPASSLLDEALREESLQQPAEDDVSDQAAPTDDSAAAVPATEEGRKGKKKKKRR